MGWNPDTGFDVLSEDAQLKALFQKAGVSEKQLQDQETRAFIYDFINKHRSMGGDESNPPPVVPPRGPPRPPSGPPRPAPPPPPSHTAQCKYDIKRLRWFIVCEEYSNSGKYKPIYPIRLYYHNTKI